MSLLLTFHQPKYVLGPHPTLSSLGRAVSSSIHKENWKHLLTHISKLLKVGCGPKTYLGWWTVSRSDTSLLKNSFKSQWTPHHLSLSLPGQLAKLLMLHQLGWQSSAPPANKPCLKPPRTRAVPYGSIAPHSLSSTVGVTRTETFAKGILWTPRLPKLRCYHLLFLW